MTLVEIEELIKSVNRNAIKAMMRNAAILGDAKATDEMKAQALDNVKAIAANKPLPKIKNKPTAPPTITPVAPAAAAAVVTPPTAGTPLQPQPSAQHEYPQDLHLSPLNTAGHDEKAMRGIFDSLPDHEKKSVVDWHAKTKINKSVDALYDLFAQLKTHL